MSVRVVAIKAPLSGVIVPLASVPDPVFSQKMVGDGISIDPISAQVLAPCSGRLVQVHRAQHALTIATPEGLEVMVHVGLDTVDLQGEGFSLTVEEGADVAAGDPLISFDPDHVATHAKSLLTQIVITNGDRVGEWRPRSGTVVAGMDDCLEVVLADAAPTALPTQGATATSPAIRVPNATGLHARPAALLANRAKRFVSDVRLRKGDKDANAKSVVGIMSLNVALGDEVVVAATGPDAAAAVERLGSEIAAGLGDHDIPATNAPEPAPIAEQRARPAASDDPNMLFGVAASPGLAVGRIVQFGHERLDVPEHARASAHDERRRLDESIDAARLQLASLQSRLQQRADPAQAAIFAAHEELLDDPELLEQAEASLAEGKSAAFAWRAAYGLCADRLSALGNELLAARATDLRDVGTRVLRLVLGVESQTDDAYPDNTILVAEDLTPSDTANLDTSKVLGFATVAGGASSHVAILARALDIPAIAGVEPRALQVADATRAVIDGGQGSLQLDPADAEVERIRARQAQMAASRALALAHAHEPAVTRDGHHLEVAANIGGLDDAKKGAQLGADGVGLLRSEFLFLDRDNAPDEEEQATVYRDIAAATGADRAVIIRTLDVGGDKPLPYLPIAPEDNPFLGERGIRVSLTHPAILRTQVRAIFRASQHGRLRIMLPMVATLDEAREVKAIIESERKELGAPPLELGIMIEVPAAALLAEQFAQEVDFFSIGTNDLTQYTLAMDRGHPRLAPMCDGLNPAVLRLIDQTVRGARRHDTWVGVCGGIASDPQAVPILLGLGVVELSVSVPAIPEVKAQIRELTLTHCQETAQRALGAATAEQVRSLVPTQE